ncbi:MAG: zinc ribbon domain-containing protein [Ignavibacteriaceae bacterium]|jgi:hypothetical protein
MKCKKCNAENNEDNKFCIECGAELNFEKSPDTKFCPSCGFRNKKEAAFCSGCGNSFSQHKTGSTGKKEVNRKKSGKRVKKQQKELNFSNVIKEHKFISIAAVVILIFLIYQSIPHTKEYTNFENSSALAESSIANVMSDSVAASVVSKFICSCGKCTDPLDVCTCETASEERSFIQAEAAKNISARGIFLAVVSKYGGLKDKYLPELNNNKTGLGVPPANNSAGF